MACVLEHFCLVFDALGVRVLTTQIIECHYVRPVRERADAVRSLGFEYTVVRLADGSGVAVVGAVHSDGIASLRYAGGTAQATAKVPSCAHHQFTNTTCQRAGTFTHLGARSFNRCFAYSQVPA